MFSNIPAIAVAFGLTVQPSPQSIEPAPGESQFIMPIAPGSPQFMGIVPRPSPDDPCRVEAITEFLGTGIFMFTDRSGLFENMESLMNSKAPYQIIINGLNFADFLNQQLKQAEEAWRRVGCVQKYGI